MYRRSQEPQRLQGLWTSKTGWRVTTRQGTFLHKNWEHWTAAPIFFLPRKQLIQLQNPERGKRKKEKTPNALAWGGTVGTSRCPLPAPYCRVQPRKLAPSKKINSGRAEFQPDSFEEYLSACFGPFALAQQVPSVSHVHGGEP